MHNDLQGNAPSAQSDLATNLPSPHPDDQGALVIVCLGGGPLFAVLAFALLYDRLDQDILGFGFGMSAMFGFIAGIICLPFVY
ncbi:MAG TPA: hypothetical protein P5572_16700, partial [Phycisphaerae bacterium]|nr:hypothetical protein [Phycisphaerae bacterium]